MAFFGCTVTHVSLPLPGSALHGNLSKSSMCRELFSVNKN